jgi:hypothetical protein
MSDCNELDKTNLYVALKNYVYTEFETPKTPTCHKQREGVEQQIWVVHPGKNLCACDVGEF